MKISKLFHWLYACLMLLPIFAVGITCAYAVFNKNAKDSYSHSEEFTYYERFQYQTNEVNSVDDLVVGNVYAINYDYVITTSGNNTIFLGNSNSFNFITLDINIDNLYVYLRISGTTTTNLIIFTINQDIYIYDDYVYGYGYIRQYVNNNVYLPFVYKGGLNSSFDNISFISGLSEEEIVNYYYYIEKTTEVSTLDNVFYDSVREVGQNPYFAWANDSFLAEPVQYITNLFGMPTDNSVITLLSYWLAISIIYLCFDVIMYIPLLAHRWLDKGILE